MTPETALAEAIRRAGDNGLSPGIWDYRDRDYGDYGDSLLNPLLQQPSDAPDPSQPGLSRGRPRSETQRLGANPKGMVLGVE